MMSSPAAVAADVEASSTRPSRDATPKKSQSPEPNTRSEKQDKGKQRAASLPREEGESEDTSAPPLPDEEPPLPQESPPLPSEPVPEDDGWAPVWDATAGAYYFYNRFTQATQWENPRVPEVTVAPVATAPGVTPGLAPGLTAAPLPSELPPPSASSSIAGGYDPAIHGDYDENAWYAQKPEPEPTTQPLDPATAAAMYEQTGTFNRFTGRWQASNLTPENFNDENKAKRQMNAFFDVDLAANSHDGKSLRAERASKKLSRSEVKQFKQKRKAKKEEKRRAWLLD